jgi:uncharacterized protein YaeQ
MTHLEDHQTDELNEHLTRLREKKISCKIKIREGKIIFIDTKDKQLIEFAKAQNEDLK